MSGTPGAGGALTSRRVALEALDRIERDDAYANLALAAVLGRSKLDRRDRALVTELVYGTIRRRRSLDHLADRFLSSDPPATARNALRLGAYQLRYTEIPDHAAVAETVEATPKRFRGLVNAVLRKVASAPVNWPDDATRLSYPDWIVDRLTDDLGPEDAYSALESMNSAPDVDTRDDGYVQDRASQWVVEAIDVAAGEVVADLCAAPGGKATGLAARGARVVAADLRASRAGLIAANVERLGLTENVLPVVADGTQPGLRPGSFDVVLLDAPCSGLGVLRRRADARWRVAPGDVDRLVALQRRLLSAAVELVRPGGQLVYSVCTLTAAESVDQARWFEATAAVTAMAAPTDPWRPWGSGAILLPQAAGTDGMSLFRWRVASQR